MNASIDVGVTLCKRFHAPLRIHHHHARNQRGRDPFREHVHNQDPRGDTEHTPGHVRVHSCLGPSFVVQILHHIVRKPQRAQIMVDPGQVTRGRIDQQHEILLAVIHTQQRRHNPPQPKPRRKNNQSVTELRIVVLRHQRRHNRPVEGQQPLARCRERHARRCARTTPTDPFARDVRRNPVTRSTARGERRAICLPPTRCNCFRLWLRCLSAVSQLHTSSRVLPRVRLCTCSARW